MNMMRTWLKDRGQAIPGPHAHHEPGGFMPGMLTSEEMAHARRRQGRRVRSPLPDGDDQAPRRRDHDGRRVVQVARRRTRRRHFRVRVGRRRGSADGNRSDGRDAEGDHEMRLRMCGVSDCGSSRPPRLRDLRRSGSRRQSRSRSPRTRTIRASDLKPGLRDAGVAARGMELVSTRPRAGRLLRSEEPGRPGDARRASRQCHAAGTATAQHLRPAAARRHPAGPQPYAPNAAAPPGAGGLDFANSDIAFSGTHMVMGNFHGFNAYDIESAKSPRLLASIVCPGGQGDVSIYGNLLFMSVEQTRGRVDCGMQGVQRAGEQGTLPRRAHLRHHRHPQSEAGRGGADLPRLAHAHAGAEGQADAVCLRLRHRRRALGRRAASTAPAAIRRRTRTPRSSAST